MSRWGPLGLAILVTACSGTTSPSTVAPLPHAAAATRFAISADRALDGTRFAELPAPDLAAVLVDLCNSTVALPVAIVAAISDLPVPPEPEGDGIMVEVLVIGLSEVCPQRAVTELAAAYLAAVSVAVAQGEGATVADDMLLTTGLSVCATLAAGSVDDALVVAAAGLFGVEASADELLAGSTGVAPVVTIGAVIASAVTYLCPEHRDRVAVFFDGPEPPES